MIRYTNNKINILFLLMFSLFMSCEDDDNDGRFTYNENRTIVEAAQRTTTLTSLVTALSVADGDLVGTLNGPGPFTVFAPTDTAFEDLASQLGFDDASAMVDQIDKSLLAQILTYHVVAGNNTSANLSDGQSLETVQGENVAIAISEENVFVQDQTELSGTNTAGSVVVPDQITANGVLHIVDKILLNQAAIDALNIDIRPNLTEVVIDTPALSLLEEAVLKAGVGDILSGDGPFTVFAPTDDAFQALLDSLGDDYTEIDDFDNAVEIALLKNILLYHVLPDEVNENELQAGIQETAFANNSIEIINDGGTFVIGDVTATNANITATDIDAINGVAHTIDKVLLPQAVNDFLTLLASDDLVSLVTNTPSLSILGAAIIKTDLVDELNDITNQEIVDNENTPEDESLNTGFTYYKPATVFAPSNTAFQDLFDSLGPNFNTLDDFDTPAEIKLLKNIVLYHVVPGAILQEDLSAGELATALEGNSLEVIPRVNIFVLGDATNDINAVFTNSDIEARNGVAHIIDKVLIPAEALNL